MKDHENLSRLESVFGRVVDLPEIERSTVLDDACGEDAVLRQAVESLLDAHDRGGLVDDLAQDLSGPLTAAFERSPLEGKRVGAYRITGLLGRGGMGNVYLADRVDGQFERQVALKLLRDGIDSEATRARFLHERQLLARLQHPGIARLLDGGLDESGRPFFAMEVVRGERIDRHCNDEGLPVRDRLQLFCQVCEAVQYAHGNLVVHRDLKPSNVMVRAGGNGASRGDRVVLLDFGIARLLEESVEAAPTAPPTRVMTPEYASPEQVRGEAATTSADIYSLGVILYELLAGRRPYDVTGRSPAEVESIICEQNPPPPSVIVTRNPSRTTATRRVTNGDRPAQTESGSRDRAIETDTLARVLSGDLDTIVMKALAKEPARRYASAEAFLNDIRRYLDGLPVLARPDTFGYRMSKFVRRNRLAVAASSVLLLFVLTGSGVIMWQGRRAAIDRDRAQLEAIKAEQSLALLVDLFEAADPGRTAGERLSANEMLDRAAGRIAAVGGEPTVRATLLDALAGVYHNLGLYDRARDLRIQAINVRRTLGDAPANLAGLGASLTRLSTTYFRLSDLVAADSAAAEAVATMRRAGPGYAIGLATALHTRAATLRATRHTDEAVPLANEALAIQKRELPANHADIGSSLYLLAAIRHDTGDFDGSEPMFREALALLGASSDSISVETADAAATLGQFLTFKGEFDEAEEMLLRAHRIRQKLYGDEHPVVITSESQLGILLYQRGDIRRAEPVLRRSVRLGEEVMGANQYDVLSGKQALALTLFELDELDEAAELLTTVDAGYETIFGGDHGVRVATLTYLGNVNLERGDLNKAESAFRQSEEMAARVFGDEHPYVGRAVQGHAAVADRRGRFEDAEALYRRALAILQESLRPNHFMTAAAQKDLGRFLMRRDRLDEAIPLLESAVSAFVAEYDSTNASVLNTKSILGEALARSGDLEKAVPMLRASAVGLRAIYGADHRFVRTAEERLTTYAR